MGLWILAAGFVALVRDGTKSIAGNAVFITRLADDWNNIQASSLESLKTLVERYECDSGWEIVSFYLLAAPIWLVFGILCSILVLISRKFLTLIVCILY